MPKTMAITIGGVGAVFLLVVGVLTARRPASESRPAAAPPRQEQEKPRGADVETPALRDRVAKLEERVRALRTRKESLLLLKADLDRELKEKGVAWKHEESEESRTKRWDRGVFNSVDDVASFLGVDPGRRQALVAAWEEARRRARLLEQSRAVVTVEGEVTTIKVSPFPDEGNALAVDLAKQVEALLTPQERDKFLTSGEGMTRFAAHLPAEEQQKYRTNRLCLLSLLGRGYRYPPHWDRTRQITIRQSGEKVSLEELDFDAKGKETGRSSWSTSKGTGQLDPLADYRHLLR